MAHIDEAAREILAQVQAGKILPGEALDHLLAMAEKHNLVLADDLERQFTGIMQTKEFLPEDIVVRVSEPQPDVREPTPQPGYEEHDPAEEGPEGDVLAQTNEDEPDSEDLLDQLSWLVRDLLFLQFQKLDLFHRQDEKYSLSDLLALTGLREGHGAWLDELVGFLTTTEMLCKHDIPGQGIVIGAQITTEAVRQRLANLARYRQNLTRDLPQAADLFRVLETCIQAMGEYMAEHARSEPSERQAVTPEAATLRMLNLREVHTEPEAHSP